MKEVNDVREYEEVEGVKAAAAGLVPAQRANDADHQDDHSAGHG